MKREHMAVKEAAVVKEQSCVIGHHIHLYKYVQCMGGNQRGRATVTCH